MSDKKPTEEELAARHAWFEDYTRRLSEQSVVAGTRPDGLYPCPCCYCLTLGERGGFEICPVCFWEDDGQDEHDADVVRGGPNGSLSLTQGRMNYASFGASAKKDLEHVRPPTPQERPR